MRKRVVHITAPNNIHKNSHKTSVKIHDDNQIKLFTNETELNCPLTFRTSNITKSQILLTLLLKIMNKADSVINITSF